MSQRVGILCRYASYPALNQFSKRLYLRHRSLAHLHGEQDGLLDHLPQTDTIGLRCLYDLAHRRVADASGRIVDDTLEGLLVVGIGYQTEVGYHVLDLLALIEAQSAVDPVWDIVLQHLLLERTALRVGAIEDGEVAPVAMILPAQPLDVLTDDERLLLVAVGRLQLQLLTVFVLRKHVLRNLSLVPSDQRIGRLHDQLRRTVVLLQFEELHVLIEVLEVQDVIDVGPSERIDTLCIVTNHTHLLALLRQLIHNGLLGKVRVLILIHEHELELLDIFLTDVFVLLKEDPRLHQQIVEVHRIGLSAPFRIPYIYIRHLWPFLRGVVLGPCTLRIGLRQHQVVLRHRDTVGHRCRLIHLVVELHLLDDRPHQRASVRLVIDGEVRLIADMLRLCPQDTCKDAVERSHLEVSRTLMTHQLANTLLHLSRSLVGKGQCQYLPGSHPLFHQPGNLVGQHTCLTRSCTCNHQTGPVAVLYSPALTLVQLL